MSRRCELTGKSPMVGHNVSHANNKTKRRFLPNLTQVSLTSEALGQTHRFRIAAATLRTRSDRQPAVLAASATRIDSPADQAEESKVVVSRSR